MVAVKSVFPYPGGKARYTDWIVSHIPEHRCWVDVFGGSGAVTYNKPRSNTEVYNDINDDLVQFFRVVREDVDELIEWLETVPYSRSVYDEWAAAYFEGERVDDPIERAGRFWTLRYMQFGGDISGVNGFKTRNQRSPARTFDNARDQLREITKRFQGVIIENKDYLEVLRDYDDAQTLFYLDPPYVDREHYYDDDEFDHSELVEILCEIDGDWMVSYDTLPEGLEDYPVVTNEVTHRMAQGGVSATERLVTNYDPAETPSFAGVDQSGLGVFIDG